MKTLFVVILNLSLITAVNAAEPVRCKDLLKRSLTLLKLSSKNLVASQNNLRVEATVIQSWADKTDVAFSRNTKIPTTGMRKNAQELLRQADTLEKFNNSVDVENTEITNLALDCE